ncbi:MAG TPA: 23S rRNA (adenine(2503)-C(2))-methyltransferase RlmN, partial [Thermomicrobiales bacterium]|nr:23S rRNA (adenine(2503)-C(2))-methyltransferase RlmN [Thermomicrobiales bacterium]
MKTIATETTTTTNDMIRPTGRARFRPHSVFEYTLDELADWFTERGEPAYRAKQLYNWVFRQLATDYGQVTVFPAGMRARLAVDLPMQALTPIHEIATDDGETLKVLYRTVDGQTLETVLMFYPDRSTVCVSCQVGCAVGCSFCATGLMGLHRNLSAGEMVAQVVDMARRSSEQGRPLTNIVMMGMGEPFHNYDNVMKMVAILNQPEGMHFGSRRITVSTSGVVPFIDKLAGEPYQVNLAIS